MTPEQNDFFTILPSSVRYDSNLSDFAKVLFSEILALSKKNGFCWATNEHFAKAFSKHETTISRAITELKNGKYLEIEVKSSNLGTVRNITPLSENAMCALSKNAKTPNSKNAITPLSENAMYNKVKINKSKKKSSLKEEPSFDKRLNSQLPFDVVSSSETIRATYQKPFLELKEDLKNIYQIEATDKDIERAIFTFSTVAVAQYQKYKGIHDYTKLCDLFKAWVDTSIKYEANKPKEQSQDLESYLIQHHREKDVQYYKADGRIEKWKKQFEENNFKVSNIAKGYKNENLSPLFFFEILFMPLGGMLNGNNEERKIESFKKLFAAQSDYNKEKGDFRKIIKEAYEKIKA